jgi:hypothetical protein
MDTVCNQQRSSGLLGPTYSNFGKVFSRGLKYPLNINLKFSGVLDKIGRMKNYYLFRITFNDGTTIRFIAHSFFTRHIAGKKYFTTTNSFTKQIRDFKFSKVETIKIIRF